MKKAHLFKLLSILIISMITTSLFEVKAAPLERNVQAPINSTTFVHTVTAENTSGHITTIDHPLLDGNPDALPYFTPNWNPGGPFIGVYNDHVASIYYSGGKWHIYNEDSANMPNGASFNIFIPSPLDDAFLHVHDSDNGGYNETLLDHPRLDEKPNEIIFASHRWDPHSVYNDNTTYVGYQPAEKRWAIFKEQSDEFNPMPENAAFNVLIPADQHDVFVVEATGDNTVGNSMQIDHPTLNGNPNAIFFADAYWDDGNLNYLKNSRANIGVWYDSVNWNVYTQDGSAIPLESKFHILVPNNVSATGQTLSVSPNSGRAGNIVTLTGTGYAPGDYVGTIRWDGVDVAGFEIPTGGSFSTSFQIPAGAAGSHTITVCSLSPCATGEFEQLASAEFIMMPPADSGPDAPHKIYLPIMIGGSGSSTPTEPQQRVTVKVDANVKPAADSLPSIEDGGAPRPLGAMMDQNGNVATFVQNEIFVETNDMSLVDRIVAEYSGEILLEIDPADSGVQDLAKMFLIRVDPSAGDTSKLADTLAELDDSGDIQGESSFSSNDAAGLMAIAGQEAMGSTVIGVNWVGEPTDPPDTAREAGSGVTMGGIGYSRDPYAWSYMNRGSVQDIGTAEAWNVLIYGGNWDNRVKYAILDKGFATNSDFPDSTAHHSIFPWVTADGDRGSSRAPWHGTHVMNTAMAKADNFYGIAGVAHTVAEPINIYTGYDYVTSIASVLLARARGAKVINMSYSAEVPAIVSWTIIPFEHTTMAVRASGTLLFASAGNDYVDVDGRDCIPIINVPCWEHTWHTPCENNGVICVGGIEWNSKMRARSVNGAGNTVGGSNFGSRGGVHIFAPYRVYRGADPDNPADGNTVNIINGTSFSSPYAGGVAALIWAADPSLSANQVWAIMRDTAHTSPDGSVPRYVNAYAAVRRATGQAVSADIDLPSAGSTTVQKNSRVVFRADLGAVLDSGRSMSITWTSDQDGTLSGSTWAAPAGESGHISTFFVDDLSVGTHTITLRIGGDGLTASDTIQVTVENTRPTATIEFPAANAEFCVGESVNFSGHSFDPNQLSGIPGSGYSWRSNRDGSLGSGNPRSVTSLTVGDHTITLTVTDDGGLTQTDTVPITILANSHPDCVNRKPTAVITSPPNGTIFYADTNAGGGVWTKRVTIIGQIGDTEDEIGDLTVQWIDSVDGVLGSGTVNTTTGVVSITHDFTAEGCGTNHSITLRVTDSGGKVNDIVPFGISVSILC